MVDLKERGSSSVVKMNDRALRARSPNDGPASHMRYRWSGSTPPGSRSSELMNIQGMILMRYQAAT